MRNTKNQTPNTKETPTFKLRELGLGACGLFGVWCFNFPALIER
jgi:hypothetical protein